MDQILCSIDLFDYLKSRIRTDIEEFWCVALNASKKIITSEVLFRGTVDYCHIHPRDIFRLACLHNASSLIIAHSHPSGDPRPSLADIRMTLQIVKASRLLSIPVVDHLIITNESYLSLADTRCCKF